MQTGFYVEYLDFYVLANTGNFLMVVWTKLNISAHQFKAKEQREHQQLKSGQDWEPGRNGQRGEKNVHSRETVPRDRCDLGGHGGRGARPRSEMRVWAGGRAKGVPSF